jgi:hypothetical protein
LGLHFGLDDATYHADPALGSTDLKSVFLDAVDFQFDKLYGEDKDTPAKVWGSAFHARVLEGTEAFERKFKVAPSQKDFPKGQLLVTIQDMREWLAVQDISTKGCKSKADFVALVKTTDPTAHVWDTIVERFNAQIEEGVTALPAKAAREIELAVEWMTRHEKLQKVLHDGTFIGGSPEVSVFYEYEGVRLKARFDYLFPGIAIDIKTFRPWRPRETRKNVIKAIRDFRYDIQSAAYRKAFSAIREQYLAGTLQVHGEEPYERYIDMLFAKDSIQWLWLFVKAEGAPVSTLIEFPDELAVFAAARSEVEQAIGTYKQFREKFGTDKDWAPEADVIVLDNEDFPPSFGIYA